MLIDLLRRERQRQTRLQGKKDLTQWVNHRGTGGGSHRQKEELQRHLQSEVRRRGQRVGGHFQILRGQQRTLQVAQHRCRMLCHVGGLSQIGRLEGRGVVGNGGSGERNSFHRKFGAFLLEEGRCEGGRFNSRRTGFRGHATRSADLGGELGHLLAETVILCLHLRQALDQELVLLLHADLLSLQLLHFKSLAFARCLSSSAVAENALYPSLLLLIICLGAFSLSQVSGVDDVCLDKTIPRREICFGGG